MEITEVRLRKPNGQESKLKAFVSVVFDGMFVVHDLRVVEGANGLFVAMPSRKTSEGEYRDMAHPITPEARSLLQQVVLSAFRERENRDSLSA